MNNDLISRSDLINAKPEFMNEKVVRDTKYQTAKDRIYAKAWNACNSYWLNTIKNAPTVEPKKEIVPVCKVTFDKEQLQEMVDKKVAELVADLERPQGEWKFIQGATTQGSLKCPFCGYRDYHKTNSNFCPNCGADMRNS